MSIKKRHSGLYHINRGKVLTPDKISNSELFMTLEERAHAKSWEASIRIVDKLIEDLETKDGDYGWGQLSSLLGYKGSASMYDADIVWKMCIKAAKDHDDILKKMMGVFLMWRFAHRDGWFAYVKDTGKYDSINEKEITVTCYFRKG